MRGALNFIVSMFSSKTGTISSKRVMGVSGMLVVLISYVYCTFTGNQMPEGYQEILITSAALLSVDKAVDGISSIGKNKGSAE